MNPLAEKANSIVSFLVLWCLILFLLVKETGFLNSLFGSLIIGKSHLHIKLSSTLGSLQRRPVSGIASLRKFLLRNLVSKKEEAMHDRLSLSPFFLCTKGD